MVLSCLMWLLGSQVGSTVRAVSALNGALSPAPQRGTAYWLVAHVFLACCFIEPKTPGMTPPTMGWVCPHHSLINKMSYRLTYSPDLWRYFLNCGFCLSNLSSAASVNIKLSSPEALVPSSDFIDHQARM